MDKEIMELRGLVEKSAKETREDRSSNPNEALKNMIWRRGGEPAVGRKEQQQQKCRGASGYL